MTDEIKELRQRLEVQKAYRQDMKAKIREINDLLGVHTDKLSDLHAAVIALATERDKAVRQITTFSRALSELNKWEWPQEDSYEIVKMERDRYKEVSDNLDASLRLLAKKTERIDQ